MKALFSLIYVESGLHACVVYIVLALQGNLLHTVCAGAFAPANPSKWQCVFYLLLLFMLSSYSKTERLLSFSSCMPRGTFPNLFKMTSQEYLCNDVTGISLQCRQLFAMTSRNISAMTSLEYLCIVVNSLQ